METLHYYDIPYEMDKDLQYLTVLRETSQREMEVLFEHTGRLREGNKARLYIDF